MEDTYEKLPREIRFNISLRLPIKSLLRFKCVSKSWLNEITNQLLHGSNRCLFMTPTRIYTFDFSGASDVCEPLPNPPAVRGLYDSQGCCNGLLCFDDHYLRKIWLYNPTTRARKLVPELDTKVVPGLKSEELRHNTNVVYYRDRIGFGYDYKSKNFKILKLVARDVYVYRLQNNSWDVIDLKGNDYCDYCVENQVARTRKYMFVLNNALHWKLRNISIIAFDLGTEDFYEVPLPDGIICPSESSHTFWDITDLQGCLHMVICKFEEPLTIHRNTVLWMEIWIMKEYGVKESWSKLLHYASDEFRNLFLLNSTRPIIDIGNLQPMVYAYSSNQRNIVVGLGQMYPKSFFNCDLQTRKVENVQALCNLPDETNSGFYVVPWTCSPALSNLAS